MHYNGEKEQQQLMAQAVAQLPGHEEDLQKFTWLLVNSMSKVLIACDDITLLENLLKLNFDKLIEVILFSLEPYPVLAEQINLLRSTTFKNYSSWLGLGILNSGLVHMNTLRYSDLETITYLLYPDVAPRHTVQDPDSLVKLYHSFTEQHVREVIGKLRQAKCFQSYADYFLSSRVEVLASEKPEQGKSTGRAEASLKAAVEVAKKIFNNKEMPQLYTFLLRVLSSLLRALETESPKEVAEAELNQHYAHYKLVKTLPFTKEFNSAMIQLLSESIRTDSHSTITFGIWRMKRDRSALWGRLYKQTQRLNGRMLDHRLLDAWVTAQSEKETHHLYPSYLKTVNTMATPLSVSQHQLFSPSSSPKKNQSINETTSEEDESSLKKTKLAS